MENNKLKREITDEDVKAISKDVLFSFIALVSVFLYAVNKTIISVTITIIGCVLVSLFIGLFMACVREGDKR